MKNGIALSLIFIIIALMFLSCASELDESGGVSQEHSLSYSAADISPDEVSREISDDLSEDSSQSSVSSVPETSADESEPPETKENTYAGIKLSDGYELDYLSKNLYAITDVVAYDSDSVLITFISPKDDSCGMLHYSIWSGAVLNRFTYKSEYLLKIRLLGGGSFIISSEEGFVAYFNAPDDTAPTVTLLEESTGGDGDEVYNQYSFVSRTAYYKIAGKSVYSGIIGGAERLLHDFSENYAYISYVSTSKEGNLVFEGYDVSKRSLVLCVYNLSDDSVSVLEGSSSDYGFSEDYENYYELNTDDNSLTIAAKSSEQDIYNVQLSGSHEIFTDAGGTVIMTLCTLDPFNPTLNLYHYDSTLIKKIPVVDNEEKSFIKGSVSTDGSYVLASYALYSSGYGDYSEIKVILYPV